MRDSHLAKTTVRGDIANTSTVPSWSSIPTDLILEELRRRGEDEVKEKPSCKSAQQGHYNVSIHVVALVIILVLSTAGALHSSFPHVSDTTSSWTYELITWPPSQVADFHLYHNERLNEHVRIRSSSSPNTSALASSSQQPSYISSPPPSSPSPTPASHGSSAKATRPWQAS